MLKINLVNTRYENRWESRSKIKILPSEIRSSIWVQECLNVSRICFPFFTQIDNLSLQGLGVRDVRGRKRGF